MNMRRIVPLCAFAFTASLSAAYSPPPLPVLVASADVIAIGEIVEVRRNTFILRIDELLAGRPEGKTIEVERFRDWTCAHRWKPYQVGQREVLFAKRKSARLYELMSGGDESEWEIADNHAASLGFRIRGMREQGESEYPGQWLRLDDVRSAIRGFRKCFRGKQSAGGMWRYSLEQICGPQEISTYAGTSKLHRYLMDGAAAFLQKSGS